MTSRLARFCISVASFAFVFDASAQNQPTTPGGPLPQNPAAAQAAPQPSVRPAPPEDELVQLKLPDADIDTVLSALEIYTGRIILRPQQLATATYNLKISKPIPKSEAILYIETVLALNNIAITPLGDNALKVVDIQRAKQEAPMMITGSALDLPASGQVATKLFQLEFARVQEMLTLFSGILNPFYGGPVPLPNANAVLITDSVSNLQRIETLLQQVDKPVTAGMKPKFYTVRNVKASELVNKLRTILTGTLQTQLGSATTYNADDRTQQIVVVTDPRQWDFFSELIERLDQKSDPNTRNEVLYLKHAKAEDVVTVLSRIISGQTTAIQRQNSGSVRPGQPGAQPRPGQPATPPPPAQPNVVSATAANNPNLDAMGSDANEFSALMTVVNDDRSNSVVVFGTSDDIRLVRELVDKLDIVLAQVRIEVVIAEVTLDDNNESGISSLGLVLEGDKLVGFAGGYGTPLNPSLAVTNGTITRVDGAWDLAATISVGSTLRKRNNSILTVPAIVTSHGKEAKFFNGETRPVVTGTIQSAAGVSTGLASSSTVTQQEIGTTLTVTPFIGVDNSVQLDMTQEVQDVIGEVAVDQNTQYIIGKRNATTYVTAKSGDIIVLGGFRKNSNIDEKNRLGPIPILGDIFGYRKKSGNRQELIFFVRPTVLTNRSVVDNAEMLKQIENWPRNEDLKKQIDPTYTPPPKPPVLDRILPR